MPSYLNGKQFLIDWKVDEQNMRVIVIIILWCEHIWSDRACMMLGRCVKRGFFCASQACQVWKHKHKLVNKRVHVLFHTTETHK